MAYKFQRGTAKLSGSITLEDNLQVDGTINLANGSLALAELDIDGGTDIGADLVDADLIIIDDGAAGANRKGALSRVKKYIYAAMSGDATASDAGALTIANDAVESGMLNDNVISGQSALGSAAAAQADELLFSDGGVLKKITFSNLEDSIFGNVSGQAAVAAGGALSLGVSAITAQTNMTGDVDDTDELMINDGGALKRVDFSVFRDAIFNDVSGDATMADGGAITIAANAIQTGMVHDDVATELAGNGLNAASGVMSLDVDPSSFKNNADGLQLSSSVAGAGIGLSLGILSLDIDELSALGGTGVAQGDHFVFSDGGTEKKITASNLEDWMFGNVSGDATIAAGGALTIGANAVQTGMVHDDVATELASGNGLAASAGVMSVNVSGAIAIGSDTLGIPSSAIGKGLSTSGPAAHIKTISVNADPSSFGLSDGQGLILSSSVAGAGIALVGGILSVDIDELSELAATPHATQDEYMISDNGTEKRISVTNAANGAFALVSGDATIAAGGALTIAAQAVENSMLADDAVGADELAANAVVNASIASNAAIDMDKLDGGSLASALTDLAQGDLMYAGDVDDSNNLKSITFSNLEDAIFGNVTGDATIAAGGALTIGDGAVEADMLAEDIISGQGALTTGLAATDELMISDAGAIKRMDVSVLGDFFAGAGLTASSGVLAVKCDNSSVEVTDSGDTVRVKALGVTNAMLAGSIANAKLSNSSVSFGGISLALGASDATPAFDLSDATAYTGDSALVTAGALNGGSITSGFGSINNGSSAITSTGTGSFGCVVISGNLTVSGQTTTVNSEIVNIADHNIVLDSNNGTAAVIDGAGITIEGGSGDDVTFQWLAGSTRMELKKGASFADFKMGILTGVDGAFSGDVSCKGVQETMQTHTEAATLSFADGAIVKCTAGAADYTLTLPAASGNSGRIFKIKRADAATYVITIDANGSETIDGYQTIGLESDYAGLSLICDGSNWLIL